ncbi:MAG: FAD-dependent oxidoreductase [Dehalococcoidales bacterium]|nr:FAD-dependent oxidoreductase [Dehalococcoidales bacterium]
MNTWWDYIQKGGPVPAWPYPIGYGRENEIVADVLILGGGVAGCHAAINATNRGAKVVVVDKGPIKRSGCSGAGVDHWHAACTNPCSTLTAEEMVEGHEEYGGYHYGELGNGMTCYITGMESWDTLLDVEKMGVQIRDVDDEFAGCEFRDEKTRLMFAYDYESRYIIRVAAGNIKPIMYKEMKRLGIQMYDYVMATMLLTEGGKAGARVIGATGVNVRTGEFYLFRAKATILAMGSPGGLWVFSTELGPSGVPGLTGDGNAMAWKAGAEFHSLEGSGPSSGGFRYLPHSAGNPHNTWNACTIVDSNGREVPWVDRDGRVLKTPAERHLPSPGQKFFTQMHANYELREPSTTPDLPELIRKGEFVLPLYADLPGMPSKERRLIYGMMVGNEGCTRYGIYDVFTKAGFDPDQDMPQAPVMPPDLYNFGAWWMGVPVRQWRNLSGGGGLVFDWDMKTTLDGLYTAGTQGAGGDHSSSAVTGRYAGRKAAEYTMAAGLPQIDRKQVDAEKDRIYAPVMRKGGMGWKELKAGLCRIMQDYCGEYKTDRTLELGLKYLHSIAESEAAELCARNPHDLARALECYTHITVAEMVFHACLARKASCSRLGFNRLDYPQIDPPEWHKFVTLKLDNGSVRVGERPMRWWLKPPYASTYEENYRKHCGL